LILFLFGEHRAPHVFPAEIRCCTSIFLQSLVNFRTSPVEKPVEIPQPIEANDYAQADKVKIALQRYLTRYLVKAPFPVREIGTVMTLLHAGHVP
jgi:hypothetical protein